jgi:hypothetical protein
MTLSERSYYLAQALAAAKSAGSYGADDVEFTNAIQERMDVAQVQAEVVRGIEGHSEMTYEEKEQELVKLNGDLLGLDEVSPEATEVILLGTGRLTWNSCIKTLLDRSGCTSPSCSSSKRRIHGWMMSARPFGGNCCNRLPGLLYTSPWQNWSSIYCGSTTHPRVHQLVCQLRTS